MCPLAVAETLPVGLRCKAVRLQVRRQGDDRHGRRRATAGRKRNGGKTLGDRQGLSGTGACLEARIASVACLVCVGSRRKRRCRDLRVSQAVDGASIAFTIGGKCHAAGGNAVRHEAPGVINGRALAERLRVDESTTALGHGSKPFVNHRGGRVVCPEDK